MRQTQKSSSTTAVLGPASTSHPRGRAAERCPPAHVIPLSTTGLGSHLENISVDSGSPVLETS